MELAWKAFSHAMGNIPLFALGAALFLLGRKAYVVTRRDAHDAVVAADNRAAGIAFSGYLLGLGIALVGAMYGIVFGAETDLMSLAENAGVIVILGSAAIALLVGSMWVNDKFILDRFAIGPEIFGKRNDAVAWVECGSSIATGCMINGILSGESGGSIVHGLMDIAVYWALGQALLVLGGKAFQRVTPYDDQKLIQMEQNVPAGIVFGGFLVALGIVVRGSLLGATDELGAEMLITAVFAAVSIVLLIGVTFGAERIFLRGSTLKAEIEGDKNVGAAFIVSMCMCCASLMIAHALNPNAHAGGNGGAAVTESAVAVKN